MQKYGGDDDANCGTDQGRWVPDGCEAVALQVEANLFGNVVPVLLDGVLQQEAAQCAVRNLTFQVGFFMEFWVFLRTCSSWSLMRM